MPQAINQSDLARMAGVSSMTVSRALRQHPDIQIETRQRIEKLAAKHGYRMNRGAQAMRKGRYGAIGLLLGQKHASSSMMPGFLAGLTQATHEAGMHLVLGELPDDQLTSVDALTKLLPEWSVDGLIVHYTHNAPQKLAKILDRYRMKAVWTNTDRAIHCVTPDDHGAARDAADRLYDLGHRRVAYIDSKLGNHPSMVARREGFVSRCRELDLDYRVVVSEGADRRWIEALLRELPAVTGLAIYRGDDACRVMHVAQLLGLSVPRDLSLLTFSPTPVDYAGLTRISMYQVPIERVGIRAVERLAAMLSGESDDDDAELLPLRWADGETHGPAPVLPRPVSWPTD